MIEFLAGIASRVKTLATDYTTARAAKIDNLDGLISAISPIRSIQRGTIDTSGAPTANTATATITAVTTGKSVLIPLGRATTADISTNPTDADWRLDLTNSTTVTATRVGTANVPVVLGFQVTEYK